MLQFDLLPVTFTPILVVKLGEEEEEFVIVVLLLMFEEDEEEHEPVVLLQIEIFVVIFVIFIGIEIFDDEVVDYY